MSDPQPTGAPADATRDATPEIPMASVAPSLSPEDPTPTLEPAGLGPPPLTVEYAHSVGVEPHVRRLVVTMLVLCVISIACPVTLLLAAASGVLAAVHVMLFGAVLLLAALVVINLKDDREAPKPLIILEAVSIASLLLLVVMPLLLRAASDSGGIFAFAALPFAALAGTAYRHTLMYRHLGSVAVRVGAVSLSGRLRRLGWYKFVFEAFWLGGIALTLLIAAALRGNGSEDALIYLAFGVLLLTLASGLVWLWALIVHVQLSAATRPRRR